MTILTEFGEKIRELRRRKGVTLGEMAKHLGVQIGYLSGVECGRKPQEPEFVKRCYDYLNSLPDDHTYDHLKDVTLDDIFETIRKAQEKRK